MSLDDQLTKCLNGVTIELTPEEAAEYVAKQANPLRYVPQQVSMKAGRKALSRDVLVNGKTSMERVQEYVNSLEGQEGIDARIDLEFSLTIERHNNLVAVMKGVLGKTDSQIDDLFILAHSFDVEASNG